MGNAGPFPARWPRTRRSAEMVANQISLDKSACVRGIHGSSASAISPGERRSLKIGRCPSGRQATWAKVLSA